VLVMLAVFGDTMKVVVIVTGSIWPILLNTIEGVRSVDLVLDETCRTYQIKGVSRLWHFVLPSASPQIVVGMRVGLSIGIILMAGGVACLIVSIVFVVRRSRRTAGAQVYEERRYTEPPPPPTGP